jgi:hypothetical protein
LFFTASASHAASIFLTSAKLRHGFVRIGCSLIVLENDLTLSALRP